MKQGMRVHTFNPCTEEAETYGWISESLRIVWIPWWGGILGQPELHRETLCLKVNTIQNKQHAISSIIFLEEYFEELFQKNSLP